MFTATADVNIFYSPAISIATAPLQRVEIRMKSDNAGLARVFWAPTPNGAAGFIGGDENDFVLVGDAAFHDYVLPIDTSSAQTIFGLRLDVPAGATVSLQSVALASLIEPSGAGVSPVWEFETDGDPMGWILYQGVADITASGGRLKVHTYANSILLAPKSQITFDREWVSLYGHVTQSTLDTPWFDLNWVSRGAPAPTVSYPMASDPADHVYNENVGGYGGWFANVSHFALALPGEEQVEFDWIRITSSPQTPPDLVVEACGPVDAPVRAGSSFQFSCRISNRGSQSAALTGLALSAAGDAVKTVSSPNPPDPVVEGYAQNVVWTLQALQSGTFPVSISAQAQAGNPASYSTTVFILPAMDKQASPYVPAPNPAPSNYDVGVFMYPGWSRYSNWDYIRSFPERMPMLGYYKDGDPRVIDWQIEVGGGTRDQVFRFGLVPRPGRRYTGLFSTRISLLQIPWRDEVLYLVGG